MSPTTLISCTSNSPLTADIDTVSSCISSSLNSPLTVENSDLSAITPFASKSPLIDLSFINLESTPLTEHSPDTVSTI